MPVTAWKFPATVVNQNRFQEGDFYNDAYFPANYFGEFAGYDFAENAWTNPGNTVSDNAVNASSSFTSTAYRGAWLWATDFGFTVADIPASASVTGIETRVESSILPLLSSGSIDRFVVRPIIDGFIAGNEEFGAGLPVALSLVNIGGSSNLMGAVISQPNTLNSLSGIAIAYDCDSYATNTILADYIQLRYHYTSDSLRRSSIM